MLDRDEVILPWTLHEVAHIPNGERDVRPRVHRMASTFAPVLSFNSFTIDVWHGLQSPMPLCSRSFA
jgi:hypothetical protein